MRQREAGKSLAILPACSRETRRHRSPPLRIFLTPTLTGSRTLPLNIISKASPPSFPLTSPAYFPAFLMERKVVSRKRMAVLTFRFQFRCTNSNHSTVVFRLSYRFKMRRPDTKFASTQMVNMKPFRDRTNAIFVSDTMNKTCPPVTYTDRPVT